MGFVSKHLFTYVQNAYSLSLSLSLSPFWQIASSIAFNCNISYPALFEDLLKKFGFVNLDLVPSLGLRCSFADFDYISKLYVITITPLCVCFLIGLPYMVTVLKSRHSDDDPKFLARVENYVVPKKLKSTMKANDLEDLLFVFGACDTSGSRTIDVGGFIAAANKFFRSLPTSEVSRLADYLGLAEDRELSLEDFLDIAVRAPKDSQNRRTTRLYDLAAKIRGEQTKMAGQVYVNIFLIWTFLILIGASTVVFFFLKCDSFDIPGADGGGEKRYLFQDYR